MDIWLHVGTGKTGTSAVQVALSRHRAALAQAGLVYPEGIDDERMALAGGITSGNAKRMGWLMTPSLQVPAYDPSAVLHWLDSALAQAAGRTLLLSSEALQCPDPEAAAPVMQRLRAVGRVRVLYLVRHALDHAVASYAQALKVGETPERGTDLASCVAQAEAPFRDQLATWETILGGTEGMLCLLYESECLGAGLTHNLLRHIAPAFAAALPRDAAPEAVNRSPTGIELAIYEKLARVAPEAARWLTRAVMNAPPAMPAQVVVPDVAFESFARLNQPVVDAVNHRYFAGQPVLRLTSGRIPVGPVTPWPQEAMVETSVALLRALAQPPATPPPPPAMPARVEPAGLEQRARHLARVGKLTEAITVLDAALDETGPDGQALRQLRDHLRRRARRLTG